MSKTNCDAAFETHEIIGTHLALRAATFSARSFAWTGNIGTAPVATLGRAAPERILVRGRESRVFVRDGNGYKSGPFRVVFA
jgi:hypothetical protein